VQDRDHEFKPVEESVVKPDLELVSDLPDVVFKCVSCGQEVLVSETDIDLKQSGESEELEVAYDLARQQHTCPSPEPPDVEDLPLTPEPFEHKEVGTPIRHILTTEAVDAILTDPNIVGLNPFFEDLTEAKATAAPYRARVWRLEEV